MNIEQINEDTYICKECKTKVSENELYQEICYNCGCQITNGGLKELEQINHKV